MDLYKRPEISPSAKVMSLVRQHHGLNALSLYEVPQALDRRGNELPAAWKKEAKMNHLRARRRSVALNEIPNTKFPVILEIDEGRNYVILRERVGEAGFLVQFPDTRESFVSAKRLEEVYDGHCIFLNPKKQTRRGGGQWLSHLFQRRNRSDESVESSESVSHV